MKYPPAVRRALDDGRWRTLAALLLLLAAVGMPRVRVPRDTYDYMVTFDVTQSMNVDDVLLDGAPVSRLALARAAMRDVLRHLPCGSTVGWSIFADYRSFPLMLPIEVCANYDVLLSSLEKIDGRMRWANASNINKGVYWSLHNLETLPGVAAIFFTDGQEAPPLRPGQAWMPALPDGQAGGWLIGVGGDLPARIPRSDADGTVTGYWAAADVIQVPDAPAGQSHEQLSELRGPYLATLATHNGLGYRRLTEPGDVTAAALGPLSAHRHWIPTNLGWLPAMLSLGLLIWIFHPDMVNRPPAKRRLARP